MISTFLIYLCICLMGLIIRTVYEILKSKNKLDPKNNVIFVIVFIGMASMLISWVFLTHNDPWKITLPLLIQRIGIAAVICGIGIAVMALIQLRGLENIDHLDTRGIFSKLRHPMYTGFILWIFGWVIYNGAVTSLLLALFATGNILYWRHLEEEKLVIEYGEEYINYRKVTWF